MDASASCWRQHDGGLASEVEQGRRCTTVPRLGRRCYGGSPSPLENTLGGKGDRVAQAASEQRTGPTATLPKEDDTHRKKTSLDGTARTTKCRKFD